MPLMVIVIVVVMTTMMFIMRLCNIFLFECHIHSTTYSWKSIENPLRKESQTAEPKQKTSQSPRSSPLQFQPKLIVNKPLQVKQVVRLARLDRYTFYKQVTRMKDSATSSNNKLTEYNRRAAQYMRLSPLWSRGSVRYTQPYSYKQKDCSTTWSR